MNRRDFLKKSKYFTLVPFGAGLMSCGGSSSSDDDDTTTSSTTLTIPSLVEPDASNKISLQANEGTTDFYDGVSSNTKGFIDVNNDAGTSYLGPTVRVRSYNSNSNSAGTSMVNQGTQTGGVNGTDFNSIDFSVFNNTSQTISSHWHGLHVDGFFDGGPLNSIASGTTWEPTLAIYQQAGTNWYHTHIHGSTAEEVYKGLAGMFIIDDANSIALDAAGLPSTYGVDDIPLIIQDKDFISEVLDSTQTGGRFAGDTMLVNGVVSANLEVEAGLIRFRILNASNARFYDFTIEDSSGTSHSYQKIASDGGFLSAPITLFSLRMGPGERNEIVIDFSAFSVGDVITLKSAENENSGLADPFDIMTFTVTAQTTQTSSNVVPAILNADIASDRTSLLANTPDAYVYIQLKGGANPFASLRTTTADANGIDNVVDVAFDVTTANFVSTSTQTSNGANGNGYTEEWHIRGATHPFHLHGCHAMIKTINGATPATDYQGWKDVFEVTGGNDVVFSVQFNERAYTAASNAGPGAGSNFMYMMHCHILGHEDDGMMGVFEVI